MIKKISSQLQSILKKLVLSIQRFPETIFVATATVIVLIYMNHLGYEHANIRENLTRLAMVLAMGIPLSLCMKTFLERKKSLSKAIKIGIYIAAVAALIVYYLWMLKDINNISIARYIALSICLYLTFSFIPYFFKRENYEFYVVTLFNRFITTYLYSGILFLGLVAIIFTINVLFTANISGKIYLDILYVVVGIFAPSFFLADIPEFGLELKIEDYSKVLKVLLLYIVMPLIVVYCTILYVYFGKILVTREWPQGILANLVLWFSIVSTIVVFFIYPLRNKNQWVGAFISFLPKLLIPLLIMMFVSLGIRINAYGITENRYFVLIAGLWVTGSMGYYTFSKKPRNIVLTISLTILCIISVIGPFSGYSVSKMSQNHRFEEILRMNDMISSENIIIPSSEVSEVDRKQISSILLYFQNRYGFKELKYVPNDFEISQTKDLFGFPLEQDYWGGPYDKYFNYNLSENFGLVDIKKYDYFADYSYYRGINSENTEDPMTITYSEQSRKLEIVNGGEVIYTKNMDEIITVIHEKLRGDENSVERHEFTAEEMTYVEDTLAMEILYAFNNISGMESYDGKITIHPPMFKIFIRMK